MIHECTDINFIQMLLVCELCRCLSGSGISLDEAITPEIGKSFIEVCDSLQAIGFSEQVSTAGDTLILIEIKICV